jgi:signal transduction histidine kinase
LHPEAQAVAAPGPPLEEPARSDRERLRLSKSPDGIAATVVVSAVATAVAEVAARIFTLPTVDVPMFAPAAGVALVAALRGGPAGLAGVGLGVWVLGSVAPGPLAMRGGVVLAAALALGTVLQAAAGAWWIRRRLGEALPLETMREVLDFIGIAACASVLGASLGVGSLWLFAQPPAEASALATGFVWWIGAANGAIVVAPLALRLLGAPSASRRTRRAPLLVPPLVAITLTAVVFQVVRSREEQRIRGDFQRSAEAAHLGIQQNLDGYVDVLHALTGLFESSEHVTPEEFRIFVRRVLPRYEGIVALQWAPVIPDAARSRFEAELGRGPLRGFAPHGVGSVPAVQAPVYVPIRYGEPAAANDPHLGLDLASERTRRAVLEDAARSGRARATPPLTLIEGVVGVVVVVPISARAEVAATPLGRAEGFIVGAFDLEAILAHTLTKSVILWILDRATGEDLFRDPAFANAEAGWHVARQRFADREWELRFAPTSARVAATRTLYAPAVLMAGLAFSGLLSVVLVVLTGDTQRIEHEVEKRTQELASANRSLRYTNDELKLSNDDLDEFARVVSHDLREPLRTIAGFNQLLQRRYAERLDQRGNDWLRNSLEGVYTLERLLDALYSYAQAGTQIETWEAVDLQRALANVCDDLKQTIDEAGAEVESGSLPTVVGDRRRLPTLLSLLIDNAIRYRGHDAPRVRVTSARERDGWVISVQDNGVGIPSEYRTRVFDLFRRLESRPRSGAGVGLAFCRRVVERRGGRIWVEPVPDGGSVFSFSIPDRQPEARAD